MIWEGNMADSSGDFNRTNLMLPVHTTRTERERREMQRILATCAIEKRTRNGDAASLVLEASWRGSLRIVIKKYI